MKIRFCALLAAALLLLAGCAGTLSAETAAPTETTAATEPAPTAPPDGNPEDVTCRGSYTGTVDETAVAALGEQTLTNGLLAFFYRAEVAAWQQEGKTPAPDFSLPLDCQSCEADDTVNSWQQFFLKRALNTWHTCQALVLQGQQEGVPTEEAYKPNLKNYEAYIADKPCNKVLYGYSQSYQPNSLHQAYLDSLPQLLAEKNLPEGEHWASLLNEAYMYYTTLGYDFEADPDAVEAALETQPETEGWYVDIRHILLVPDPVMEVIPDVWHPEPTEPVMLHDVTVEEDGTVVCAEEAWEQTRQEAEDLLTYWRKKTDGDEPAFAQLANQRSEDTGSANDGGAYRRLTRGQLIGELDEWCFHPDRAPGDTTVVRSPYGYHALYFCGRTPIRHAMAEDAVIAEMQKAVLETAREKYPMTVEYDKIRLPEETGGVTASQVLYPDVGHQRFPEVPLYLQQDYPDTRFGIYKIAKHGCGITTMAMVASYFSDDDMTPPRMCRQYEAYCFPSGTDGAIFEETPPEMGFYCRKKVYEWRDAKAAMEEGQVVVCVQYKGYWTRDGHYLVMEKMDEDGMIQIRDSNIYNYTRLRGHQIDRFSWDTIIPKGMGYWIFEDKVVTIPACSRCGGVEGAAASLQQAAYLCEKCVPAMLRRDTFLTFCPEG